MILHAYAWASGLIQFGLEVPEGACAVCHGDEDVVKQAVQVMAANTSLLGLPVVPGTTSPINQHDNMSAMLKWLKWCRGGPRKPGLTWHGQKELT